MTTEHQYRVNGESYFDEKMLITLWNLVNAKQLDLNGYNVDQLEYLGKIKESIVKELEYIERIK